MKLQIEIEMDNASFEKNGRGFEVARILERQANLLQHEIMTQPASVNLLDSNGNTVGYCRTVE